MASTPMIHVRIDAQVKTEENATLAALGLSISDAVRVFLTRVAAEQRLPFVVAEFALEQMHARGACPLLVALCAQTLERRA